MKNYSKGDPTKDENDQDAIFAQGHAAFLYGNGWEVGAVQSQRKDPNDPNSAMVDTAVKGKVAAVPLPGASAGQGLPSFLGGSAIAVTGKSQNKALAQEWIKYFTDTKSQEGLIAKGALPNATALLDKAAAVKGNEATAIAAKNSWFLPKAPKWADVERQQRPAADAARHRHRQEVRRGRDDVGRRRDQPRHPQRLDRYGEGGPPAQRRAAHA